MYDEIIEQDDFITKGHFILNAEKTAWINFNTAIYSYKYKLYTAVRVEFCYSNARKLMTYGKRIREWNNFLQLLAYYSFSGMNIQYYIFSIPDGIDTHQKGWTLGDFLNHIYDECGVALDVQ